MLTVLPGEKDAPRVEFCSEILRAMICNAPAAMHYAGQYGLSPAEVRAVIYEALLHAIGDMREPGPDTPIVAHPPEEFRCKSASELHMLLGDYAAYKDSMKTC
ncbi:MAG: hypothetical protein DELT_02389 [Desulfovibrio sp.]